MSVLPIDRPAWHARAACLGVGPDEPHQRDPFYPEQLQGVDTRRLADDALALCRRCEVKRECLDWALANREHGVWGGTTEGDRVRDFGVYPSNGRLP